MRCHLPMTNQGVTWVCHLPMDRPPFTKTNETDRSDRNTFVLIPNTPNKQLFAESTAAPGFNMPWTSIGEAKTIP